MVFEETPFSEGIVCSGVDGVKGANRGCWSMFQDQQLENITTYWPAG